MSFKPLNTIKEIPEEDLLIGGSPACSGCPAQLGLKLALKALGKDTIVVNASGCMTLLCNYPNTPLNVSWIHSAIENAPATAIGIIKALKARKRDATVLCYVGDGACYPDDTEIFTEAGFKNVGQLKKGEMVWSVNPWTNELELQKIEKMYKYKYSGKMVGAKSRYLDFLVTPNHNVPIWRNNKWEFIKAEGLKKRYKTRTLRMFKWQGTSPGDSYLIPEIEIKTSQKTYKKVSLAEWLQFLGWYISEGCLYKSKSGYTIQIYQSNKKNRKEILKLTRRLGFSSCECSRSVNFSSKQIYDYLDKECGNGSNNKKIPRCVLKLDKAHLREIFRTLIRGDGYNVKPGKGRTFSRIGYITKSEKLMNNFVELVLKLGMNCIVRKDNRGIYRIGIQQKHLDHIIYPCRKDLNLKQVYEKSYKGFVYCPQLNKNHIVIIKRNGKISANGNSYDIGFQSLSYAMTRQDIPLIYVCYNNESYANTGFQWATSTPYLAATKTSPVGAKTPGGNILPRKDMAQIMAAHKVYVATASAAYPLDYMNKLRKAQAFRKPAYIEYFSPCQPGWGYEPRYGVMLGKLAVETGVWPLYEIENNRLHMTYEPKELKPVGEFLKYQDRYRHLDAARKKEIQDWINEEWRALRAGEYWGVREY